MALFCVRTLFELFMEDFSTFLYPNPNSLNWVGAMSHQSAQISANVYYSILNVIAKLKCHTKVRKLLVHFCIKCHIKVRTSQQMYAIKFRCQYREILNVGRRHHSQHLFFKRMLLYHCVHKSPQKSVQLYIYYVENYQ